MKIIEILGKSGSSQHLVIKLLNQPSKKAPRLIVESAFISESGVEKNWGNGYSYRLDRRPTHQGGDQIHIYRRNDAWAYRHDGSKSEPTKYTTPATREVQDIVRNIFKLGSDAIIESHVISASSEEIVFEVLFG